MNQTKIYADGINYSYKYQEHHQSNPQHISPVIEGYFPKEDERKEMSIRKVNTTLSVILGTALLITAISYYFVTANEIVLNNLRRQTVVLNDENSDLQNKLDKLKSFNNVDMTMQKSNLLQKAQQVIEIPAVQANVATNKRINTEKPFTWAIGY